MAEVDTSIYKNQPNPLGTAQGVFNLLNTAAQNNLFNTATQQRALELQQSQANDLLTSVAPLINKEGVTQAEVKATLADRARQLGISGLPAYNIAAQRYNGPDWQNNLKIDAMRAVGVPGITSRTPTINEQGAGSSVPDTSALGKPLPTSLGPKQAAAASAAGQIAGGSAENARVISANLNTSTYGLKQAITNLEHLGLQGSGPTTRELTAIKSFLISTGAYKVLPGVTPEMINNVTDYQVANKYLNDWARASGDTHTVSHLEAAQESNPNMSLAQQTNLKVARTGLALARMKFMQQQEFDNTNLPDDQFNRWVSTNWNTKHDPAVFLMDQLSLKKRQEYLNGLSDKRPGKNAMSPREQFLFDLGRAEQLGAVQK